MTLHASGATAVRVKLTRTDGDAVAIAVADTSGTLVASVGSLVLRPMPDEQLTAASSRATPCSSCAGPRCRTPPERLLRGRRPRPGPLRPRRSTDLAGPHGHGAARPGHRRRDPGGRARPRRRHRR
ncbi:hypothetical protein ACFQ2B_00790 [Streptomyces stramineus]